MSAEKKTKAKAKKTTARRRQIGRRPGQDKGVNDPAKPEKNLQPEPQETRTGEDLVGEIPVRISRLLRETIQEVIDAAKAAGDYTYVSFSDFVRAAMLENMEDSRLLAQAQRDGGKKQRTSVKCSKEIMDHWQSWPARARTEMLERALRTKLLRMGGQVQD